MRVWGVGLVLVCWFVFFFPRKPLEPIKVEEIWGKGQATPKKSYEWNYATEPCLSTLCTGEIIQMLQKLIHYLLWVS